MKCFSLSFAILFGALLATTPVLADSVTDHNGESLKSDSKETWGWRTAMLTSLMLTLGTNPVGADEYSASFMHNPGVAAIKVGFRWHQDETLMNLMGADLTHYYLVAYNYWQSLDVQGQEGVNNALEFIPVFRFNYSHNDIFSFVETSVGVSWFARTQINEKEFSTHFQFANSLAVGGYFNPKTSWSLQLQHYSNNSIELPNNGINFYNFNVAYRY